MESNNKWFYAGKGEQLGPFELQHIQQLIADDVIGSETKVWNGEGNWQAAKDTSLADFLKKQTNTDQTNTEMPPPLTGDDIDNKFVWAAVGVPIVGAIIELMAGRDLFWLYIIANIVCCSLDEQKLRKAGHKSPTKWAIFLVPVYLWMRADLTAQKKYYFWAWCASFIFSMGIAYEGNQMAIADGACPVVTDIIQQQLGSGGATCKAVEIDDEVSDGFYKATATLDNGNTLNITIEDKGGGKIYVQIPSGQ